jgi:hypothetical protein
VTPLGLPKTFFRRGRVFAAVLALLAVLASGALAYYTATGTGSATASVGTLSAPTGLAATPSGSTVSVSWNAVTPPGSGAVGYYVSRDGSAVGGTCGTPASPIAGTSCSDTGVTTGSHSYTVTAVWHSWTAVSGSAVANVSATLDHFTLSAPSSATAGSAISVTVVAKDAANNTLPTYTGTIHFTSTDTAGTVELPSNYTFVGGDNGSHTFTSGVKLTTAGSKTVSVNDTVSTSKTGTSAAITVSPASATTLAFTTQPGTATAGAIFGQQPVIKTQDAFGNSSTVGLGASRNVTVAIASGGGTLQGTQTLDLGTGAGNGTATFTNLRIDQAGAKTLSATAAAGTPTLTAATSASFTVGAASATTVTKTAGDSQSALTSTAFATALKVTVTDAFSNPVPGATVTFTAPATGASGVFANSTNTTAATTAADGTATASAFTANGIAGTYGVSASATGTNGVSFSLTNIGMWTWAANGTAQTWTTSTAKSVAYPAGTTSGDLLLLALVQQNNGTAPTLPSPWLQLGSVNKGNAVRLTVYWRAAGAETSISLTPPANSAAWVVRYTRPGGPAPAVAGTATTSSPNASATSAAPVITTTGTNATVVSLVGIPTANTFSLATAQSFTLRGALTSTGPNTAFGLADRSVSATGSVTAPTWQQSGTAAEWAFITGAFN